jgi:hypothetical protein
MDSLPNIVSEFRQAEFPPVIEGNNARVPDDANEDCGCQKMKCSHDNPYSVSDNLTTACILLQVIWQS